MESHTGYAKSGNAYVGYSATRPGDRDLLYIANNSIAIASLEEEPHAIRYFDRLAAFTRVIRFDVRGVGTSDPIDATTGATIEGGASDACAVLDAAGAQHAVVVGESAGALIAIELAARMPDRVTHLVLVNAYARLVFSDDYPIGIPEAVLDQFLAQNISPDETWEVGGADDVSLIAPSLSGDAAFREWWGRASQRGASPASALAILAANVKADLRPRLAQISVPTLVLHRVDNVFVAADHGRYIADHIPGARFQGLPGADHHSFTADFDGIVDEIEEFVTGRRRGDIDRVVQTLIFTDIVDSTGRAVALGDRAWRALLDAHDAVVRAELDRYGGREINTTGDGFLAAFDSPTQAVRAGAAMVDSAARHGVAIRVGIHTGECERRGNDLAGLSVHIAARVAGLAASGEVLVSRTVRDLVAGTDLRFVPKGEHELKGVPDTWQLFALQP